MNFIKNFFQNLLPSSWQNISEDSLYLFYDISQYVLNGIAQGSIYALIALGYTMVYGIIKLINFAHGEFYMMGAFLGFGVITLGYPLYLALPIAMLGSGLIAVIVEFLVYRPLRNAGRLSALITAVGMSIFFQSLGQLNLGAEPRAFPSVIAKKTIPLFGDVAIENTQIIIIAITFGLMMALTYFVKYTKMGKAMRATSFNHNAARLMGININRVISLTFFIGAGLAGAAGVLVGMYYNTIDPMMGMLPGIKAFVAAVFGGIGIIPGAVIGSLILGVSENLVVGLWHPHYRDAVAFFILIFILLVRPQGILGKNRKEKV